MADHRWQFFRAGGFDQVALERAEDLRALAQLDQKLWVALACPVSGTTLDEATLKLIDEDGDGRIRAPQLLSTIAWMDEVLKDLGELSKRRDGLPLASLRTDTAQGGAILASARRIIEAKGLPADGAVLKVADADEASALLNAQPFNGDGVLPPTSITDDALRALAEDVLKVTGGAPDRSGAQGITAEQVATFWEALDAYAGWWRLAEVDEVTLVPLGDHTAAAVEAYLAVREKIDDFFTRGELAAFDPRASAHLSGAAAQWEPISARVLSPKDDEIAAFPIAAVAPGASMPLGEGVNPAWAARVKALREQVVTPLLGPQDALTREQWDSLGARFAAYEAWMASKAGAAVEGLGIARVREQLASGLRAPLEALIAADEERRPEADALGAVTRAVRFYRDLHRLIDNFVSFRDFYARPELAATFQIGDLYLDGRACGLCVRVEDAAKHSAMAAQSNAYLAYCECVRKSTNEKMTIAAAFTDGDADFLMVGRNGLFYDRQGRDWDATIVKLVEQPISIRQAFWAPYKRLIKLINEQFERFASTRDKAASERMSQGVTTQAKDLEARASTPPPPKGSPTPSETPPAPAAAAAATPPAPAGAATVAAPGAQPAPPPSAFDIGKYAGIFAAVGLALGFIVSAMTAVATGFLSLKLWQMPIAIGCVLLLISGPSMMIAALKLRQRSLAPILDASGWAINARARINIPFGASLTSVAELPKGAQRSLRDPYHERPTPWWLYALLVAAICAGALLWDHGIIQQWLALNPADSVASAPTDPASKPPEAEELGAQ